MADLVKAIISVETKGQQSLTQLSTAVGKTEQSLKKLVPGADRANQSMVNLSRVVQDAPFGFIGIANNIDPLLQSFTALKASTGSTGGALKALGSSLLGGGGLALGVSVVTSALVVFGDKLFGAGKAAKEAKSAADSLKEAITGIYSEQTKEAAQAATFVAILKSETETRDRKLSAIKELQKIQPEIFEGLKLEGNAVIGLDAAYSNYIENLKTVIAAKIKQAQLEQLIGKLLEKQGVTLTDSEKKLKNFTDAVQKGITDRAKAAGGAEGLSYVDFIAGKEETRRADEAKLKSDIDALIRDISGLSKGIKVPELKIKPDKVKVEGDFKAFSGPLFSGNIEINPPPEDETKRDATTFAQMFYEETNNYLKRQEPIDVSLIDAVKAEKEFQAFADSVDQIFNSLRLDGLTAVGEAIGAAFSGGDLKSVFSGFLSTIGSGIQSIGKQIIALSITAKTLKSALRTIFTNPALGLAVGVGLVAVGAAFKNIASKGIAGARALGGPVGSGRTYLVGERGPELFTPGISGNIIPNNRMGSVNGAFGGMQVSGYLTGRGNDLVAVIAAAGRSNTRLG
jgi:hypothetical protein